MAIRYLRRPPKPMDGRAAQRNKMKRKLDVAAAQARGAAAPEVLPDERAKMATALAYFCVVCGREHPLDEVGEDDICRAEAKISEVVDRDSLR